LLDLKPFHTELGGLIASAWPEVVNGYRGTEAAHLNWRDALLDGKISPPFVIIRPLGMSPRESDDVPITEHYWDTEIEVYYVRSTKLTDVEKADGLRVEDVVEAKCLALFELIHIDPHTTFQMVDDLKVDCTDQNEVNQLVATRGAPYFAGAVKGSLLVWEPHA